MREKDIGDLGREVRRNVRAMAEWAMYPPRRKKKHDEKEETED